MAYPSSLLTMRLLLLAAVGLAILFSPLVQAQATDSLQAVAPESAFRLDLAAIGLVSGVVAAYAIDEGLELVGVDSDNGAHLPILLLAYPAGVAAGVCMMGREWGLVGTCRGARRGAVRGALFGYGAGAIVAVILVGTSPGFDELAVGLFAGGLVALAGPPVGASLGYLVAPATLRQPDGSAPGLALRVRI